MAAATPIETTRTKLFMIISFRIALRKSHNFLPTSTARRAAPFNNEISCQGLFRPSVFPVGYLDPLQKLRAQSKVKVVSFSLEYTLMNVISPISYFCFWRLLACSNVPTCNLFHTSRRLFASYSPKRVSGRRHLEMVVRSGKMRPLTVGVCAKLLTGKLSTAEISHRASTRTSAGARPYPTHGRSRLKPAAFNPFYRRTGCTTPGPTGDEVFASPRAHNEWMRDAFHQLSTIALPRYKRESLGEREGKIVRFAPSTKRDSMCSDPNACAG